MKIYKQSSQHGFVAMVSLLVVLVLAALLVIILYKRPVLDQSTTKTLQKEGIDTTNQMTIVNGVTDKIKAIEQQQLDAEDKLFKDLE